MYASQVEWATEGTFESLNITDDPTVRAFLRIWLEQERVHAELLTRLLEACGVEVEPLHRLSKHRRGARRGRFVNQLAHAAVGDDFFAVHMTWGAVNELSTLRFYQQIRHRTAHPLLREILRDVIGQEAMHYSFYRAAAIERLTERPRAQRLTSWVLRHLWTPVGVGLRTRSDAHRLAH
ncbi:MAG TPA: ferritin family protein, partial [Acidimicrobiia bacterium]